jgi:pimeloyl-ACP methyl ester carboxylesterase
MQKNLSYKQKNIAYRIIGNGQPVVLIHGFGEDSKIWDKQIDFLASYCQLIVPDLPGSGKSALVTEKDLSRSSDESISISDYADIINALLLAENIDCCIMLGHSMGGYITLAFAEKYAEKLLKFGLVHSSALADTEEKKATRLKGIELMDTYGAAPFLKNTIPNLFSSNFKKEHLEMVSSLIDASQLFSTQACKQYYRAMMNRPDRTSVLKGNPKPILFVIGTEDVAAPMADVLPQTTLPIQPYHYILEGVGHMGMWEATVQLNQILIDFIQL